MIMNKMLCMGAMALSMMTGAALAGGGALDEPTKMSPFYTAADMKTLKSEAEFKAAWTALKAEDRAGLMKECGDADVFKAHNDFCQQATKLGG
jgi:hypothetical protein